MPVLTETTRRVRDATLILIFCLTVLLDQLRHLFSCELDGLVDPLARDVRDGFLIAMMVGELIVGQLIGLQLPSHP